MPLLQKYEKIKKRIPKVIHTNAINVERSIFLATHKPFNNLEFLPNGVSEQGKGIIGEGTFFEKCLLESQDAHKFIVVQGDNGSGKSHLIRWLKEKYLNQTNQDEEAVLFISKSQSTLRGALQQIIESKLFEESDINNHLRKLVQANEHLKQSNLNKQIIAQFAIEASEDEDVDVDNFILAKKYKKNLYSFLVEPIIQRLLFSKDGPIERIKSKLNAEITNQINDNVSPRFTYKDFEISIQVVTELKNQQVNRKVLKLAENLSELSDGSLELRKQLAEYLNQFLEPVVQKCTNLRGADLEEVFKQLRRELKKSGKNLTLFIEDITSFTGIDRALVDVLITDHTGEESKQEYCRICSVIGITNDYYNNSVPTHIQDRITSRLLIDNAFVNNDEIVELAARYINVLYLEEEELERWANSANENDYPIVEDYLKYKWANVTLSDGREMSLFPFNKASLIKFYEGIKPKTPRMFLRLVLSNMLSEYCEKIEFKNFPAPLKELSLQYDIPNWHKPLTANIVERQAPNQSERLSTLLRLWGDQTVLRRTEGDVITVGGLPEEVFKCFDLPFINGELESNSMNKAETDKNRTKESNKENSRRGTSTFEDNSKRERGNENNNEADDTSSIPEVQIKTKEELDFEKLQEELESWKNDNRLFSYRLVKDSIHTAINDFIDWESEEVPPPFVNIYFSAKQIEIEGQASKQQYDTTFLIERNNQSYNAFIAIGAWHHLGKKSWSFPDAANYLSLFYNWITSIKDQVITAVKQTESIKGNDSYYLRQWSIISTFYFKILSGSITHIPKKYDDIYNELFKPITIDIKDENHRSEEWKGLEKRFNQANPKKWLKSNHELLCEMDNHLQGSITQKTEVFFLDAVKIIREVKDLISKKWDLSSISLPTLDSSEQRKKEDDKQFSPYFLLKELKEKLPISITNEISSVNTLLSTLCEYTGEEKADQRVTELIKEMKNILEYFKENNVGYNSDRFMLLNSNTKKNLLIKAINSVDKINSSDTNLLQFIELIKDPGNYLTQYISLFNHMDNLLSINLDKYNQKRNHLQQQESSIQVSEVITKTKSEISKLTIEFEALQGSGN